MEWKRGVQEQQFAGTARAAPGYLCAQCGEPELFKITKTVSAKVFCILNITQELFLPVIVSQVGNPRAVSDSPAASAIEIWAQLNRILQPMHHSVLALGAAEDSR